MTWKTGAFSVTVVFLIIIFRTVHGLFTNTHKCTNILEIKVAQY